MMLGAGEEEGEEERAIELQIEHQLEEQNESLASLDEALAFDPSNPELLSIRDELFTSIKDAEEGLLHLKRSRLLKEADLITSKLVADVDLEPLRSNEREVVPLLSSQYAIGSKCRFRHSDGRWYNGRIVGLEEGNSAIVSFLNPTSENMTICKFHLQQRCRFGTSCRLSHGMSVPISSLKQYIPTVWQQSLIGSSIWAASDGHPGIWKEAELEAWDDKLMLAQVSFQDGTSAKVDTDMITLSRYAQISDKEESEEESEEEEDCESEEEEEEEEEEEDSKNGSIHRGLGFMQSTISQSGIQTETTLFAKWENHTRGIASKMMVGMGYREGMGLGASGQGIVDPISVKVIPPKHSLDHAFQFDKTTETESSGRKKRSRGGKRKREKKFAEAARAAKAHEEPESNVFSFINEQLAGRNGNSKNSGNKQRIGTGEIYESMKKGDRRSLVAHDDKVKDLQLQVEKLEEMANRNRKDKVIFEAASRKLIEVRRNLSDAEAAHVSASNALVSKEKEKRWLKF